MSQVTGFGPGTRVGFFTDTSVCIGCKACEVACKEWNGIDETLTDLTAKSYDNTADLGADAWRHVAFIEQRVAPAGEVRWLMSSDVCKHCTNAACLDVCPTGSLFRTEFDTVVVQADICNGCGYCVPACPYGVIDRRETTVGRGSAPCVTTAWWTAWRRPAPSRAPLTPSCSATWPSCGSGLARASTSWSTRGFPERSSTGPIPNDGVGGAGAMFLLLDDPEVYGLPPDPVVTTRDLAAMWRAAGAAAVGLVGLIGAGAWRR